MEQGTSDFAQRDHIEAAAESVSRLPMFREAYARRRADLDCHEGFDGGFRSCEVNIEYSIATDYNGNDDPNVNFSCDAEIRFSDQDGFEKSESENDSDSTYIYGDSGSGEMDLDFSFSLYEAHRVRLTDAECEIDSVY